MIESANTSDDVIKYQVLIFRSLIRNSDLEQDRKHPWTLLRYNNEYYTPLHMAAIAGCISTTNTLLTCKLKIDSINATTLLGNTPLHEAAQRGYCDIVIALLQAGAQINLKNKQGLTALELAINNKHYSTTKVLFEAIPNCELNLEKRKRFDLILDI